MSHNLTYDSETGCVILRIQGRVTMKLIQELAPQVARMFRETKCQRFLNDMSTAVIDVSFMDVYGSPKAMDESGITRDIRRALVVPSDFKQSEFLETVTRNRGHDLRIFTDVDEAKRWLLS